MVLLVARSLKGGEAEHPPLAVLDALPHAPAPVVPPRYKRGGVARVLDHPPLGVTSPPPDVHVLCEPAGWGRPIDLQTFAGAAIAY